jgi:CheY-like chemotaxis protein
MIEEFAEVTALIADRATLFRHGLRGLLKEHRPDWSCAEAGTPEEMLAHLRAEPVDLLLFDMQLGGVAALLRLRQEFPHQKMVVLADTDDRTAILESLGAGVNGYVLKSTTMSQHWKQYCPAACSLRLPSLVWRRRCMCRRPRRAHCWPTSPSGRSRCSSYCPKVARQRRSRGGSGWRWAR